jgi:integral membrane protein
MPPCYTKAMKTARAVWKFLNTVDRYKLFAEPEAWFLFKYAALSEVVGWSLLIYGILAEKYRWPAQAFALPVGGSVHGMLFLGYIGILAATYSSLGWTRKRALTGFFVSALPYGTYFFERWAERKRRQSTLQSYRRIVVRGRVTHQDRCLAIQPSNGVAWCLPGGYIGTGESPEQALARLLRELTGVTAKIGPLYRLSQPDSPKANDELTLYFDIANGQDFATLDLHQIARGHGEVEELRFVDPAKLMP